MIEYRDIADYLMTHKDFFKEHTLSYKNKKEELCKTKPLFYSEIKDEYEKKIRSILVDDVCRNLAVDSEAAYVIIESINLEEYLK